VVLGRLQHMHRIELASVRRLNPDGQVRVLASFLVHFRSFFLSIDGPGG
jgi:hypothetical protein